MGSRRRERIESFTLTRSQVEQLMDYNYRMYRSFDKSLSTSQTQTILGLASSWALGKMVTKFAGPISGVVSGLVTAIGVVLDDLEKYEAQGIKSNIDYGYDGLYNLKSFMDRKNYKTVVVKFGVLDFLDEGFKVVTSDYQLISADGSY